jgi:hypothetical protein
VLILGVALVACRRAPPPSEPPTDLVRDSELDAAIPERGPATWRDGTDLGISVAVPAGWSILLGRTPAERVRFVADAGVEVRLLSGSDGEPRTLDGCAWVSVDHSARHRLIPALEPASLASCAPIEPEGPLVFAWIGRLATGSTWLHVELAVPPGEWVAGQDLAEPLLRSIALSGVVEAMPRSTEGR